MSTAAWSRLPLELQQRAQWLLAGPNDRGELKVPLSVRADGGTVAGSSTNPAGWLTFEAACAHAERLGLGVGYVLSAADPYCCVDLDIKDAADYPGEPHKWTTEEQRQRHYSICAHLHSYTEFSRSGKGAHIWVRANIGEGCKRDGVEVYSQERFIVCTGNVIAPLPIAERQEMMTNMVSLMREAAGGGSGAGVVLEEQEAELTDDALWARASGAENGEKFRELCAGNWARYHYPSQSEADLSLMSMFTFYSRSNEQCRRLFRLTELGRREKAQKDDRYLNLTLRIVRGRQAREAAFLEHLKNQPVNAVAATQAARRAAAPLPAPAAAGVPPAPVAPVGGAAPPAAAALAPAGGLDWPPGYAGAVARVVYESAPRPVKEVAIVAALGFLAGIAGKVWTIPGSGLNMYIVLIARSGVGKEAMHSGLGLIVSSLRERLPGITSFVNFNEFASAPALAKACAEHTSFVNVSGEWGRKLSKLANDKADGTMQGLRTLMTNLYQKSGPTAIVGGTDYSNKEKNISAVTGVAYSMIGESTPETFYRSLTDSMMEDGFLSRFLIISYDGKRPGLNHYPRKALDQQFYDYTANFLGHAMRALGAHNTVPVIREPGAAALLDAFDLECDERINATEVEQERMMWNRAHLKASRLAALLAVGDCFTDPCVHVHHAQWALNVVRRDLELMQRKLDEGEVGASDNARERKALAVIREYVTTGPASSHKIPPDMQKRGIIPRSYLLNRLQHVSVFSSHPLGSNHSIDATVRSLVDSGWLMELDKKNLSEDFGFRGRCFQLMQVID